MYLFGLELRKDTRIKDIKDVMVTCSRCSRNYMTSVNNIRVPNYCSSCK